MRITKLDAAERQIITAVKLFFDGGDRISTYALGAAAREVTTTLCQRRGITSFLDDVQQEFPELSSKELLRLASRHAAFFKHADRDPDAVLTDFSEEEVESVLFTAAHDFGRLCGGKPVEAQVFEAWYLALHLVDTLPDRLAEIFPDIKSVPRDQQVELGRKCLVWAATQAEFKMHYSTD